MQKLKNGEAKNNTARSHHYVPQGYLGNFTDTCTKEGKFFVLDVNSDHSFKTSPANVATMRDFNRIDIDGYSLDFLEKEFSKIENGAINAIRNTVVDGKLRNHEDFTFIMNLICLLAIRNPTLRQSFNNSRETVLNLMADMLVSDKETWEKKFKAESNKEVAVNNEITFERMKEFVKGRKYKIEFNSESNLRYELKVFGEILLLLGSRKWSLIVAPAEGPEFICSDHPVTLVHKKNQTGPLGFGLKNTEVFFPLSPNLGLFGVFESPLKSIIQAAPEFVAILNSRTLINAKRHVFSRFKTFFMTFNGEVSEINCDIK